MTQTFDAERFDRAYYRRYYEAPATRVADRHEFERLGEFACAYLTMLGATVDSILDVGCGTAPLKSSILRRFPKATYHGIDVSEYVCAQYGWQRASINEFESDGSYDLVICHDVLQYLNRPQAAAAIEKLADLCSGFMLFGVLTREDWRLHCDQSRTDGEVSMRSARWYRQKLRHGFRNLGGGLYASHQSGVILYELDHLD